MKEEFTERNPELQEKIRAKRNRKTLISIVVLLAVLAAAWFLISNVSSDDKVSSTLTAITSYSAEDLVKLPSEKLIALEGNEVEVSGAISDVANEEDGITIVLSADEEGMNSITCQIDNAHLTDAEQLTAEQNVKLSGVVTGHSKDDIIGGSSVELKNCKIKN